MHEQELLSLSDIARLAHVQRPVVTVWRSRNKGSTAPFPRPAQRIGAQDLFATADVVEWLQATGRGNNPEFTDDAAAHSSLARENFHEITSLLLLQQSLGQPLGGMSAEDLLDAADEVDPDDEFLYSELEAAAGRLDSLARYVERLIDAAYDAPSAFESLLAERFRAEEVALSRTSISAAARRLAALCALELSGSALVFHEASAGGSDLILEVLRGLDEAAAARILPPAAGAHGDPRDRLAVRRLKMLGSVNDSLSIAHPADDNLPVVHLAQFPSPGMPEDDPESILQALDELVLELGPSQGSVVIAPANALVDELDSKAASGIRAQILRMGRVRAAARLPQGHLLYKPRAAMALWVIGPEVADVPLAERRMMLANLSTVELDESVTGDFIADLGASLMDVSALRAHAFRFAQWARTSAVIASTTDLIPAKSASRALPGNTAVAAFQVEIDLARERLNATAAQRPVFGIEVEARKEHGAPAPRAGATPTLGELISNKSVRLISGTRFDQQSLAASAKDGLRVWTVADLREGSPSASVSYFDLASSYGQAALTVPGDVVFSAHGGPTAVVDREGSHAVSYPARILRIDRAKAPGIIHDVVAMDISAANHPAWRRWEIHRFPAEVASELGHSLVALAEERQLARQRIARLDDMSHQLIKALSSGELEILVPDTGKEGRP